MSVESNLDVSKTEVVVREILAAFEAGDVERLLTHYPEDGGFTYIDMSEPETVLSKQADLRNWVHEFGSAFDTSTGGLEVVSLTAREDRAAVELNIKAKYIGEGAPDGGKDMELRFCVVYGRIVDGLVREERVYAEPVESQVARALGS